MNENDIALIKNKPSVVLSINQQDKNYWYSTNDGVMGGLSEGRMLFNHEYGLFTGNISLANNGGFSSVYRDIPYIPNNTERVSIDIEGDGQTYQLRLALNINGDRITYKHDFKTKRDIRQQISFSLNHFKATYRGQIIQDAPLIKPENISEVGFLLADKKAGKFALIVHKISFQPKKLKNNLSEIGA